MAQHIEPMKAEDLSRVEKQRAWVRDHYTPETRHEYDSIEGKLRLLDVVLRANWIRPDETLKLQSLGITLGDALAQRLGLEWMAVEDEHGRDPCLVLRDTSVVLFPLTMISKRVERGETVDVRGLFNDVCAWVTEKQPRLPDRQPPPGE